MNNNKINNKTVYLFFSDIAGNEKCLTICTNMLNNAVNSGLLLDGSDIAGISEIFESEYILYPQLNTIQIMEIENQLYFSYKCMVTTFDGIDVNECSNELMSIALNKAKQFGLTDVSNVSGFLFKSQKPKILLSAS